MHHKEVTLTHPGSETSMAVGTISFITDDAEKKKEDSSQNGETKGTSNQTQ